MRLFSLWWYVAAAVMAATGWLAATANSAAVWDDLRVATVMPVDSAFDAADDTVAVLTNLRQPDRHISCFALGPGEDERTPIRPAPVEVTVNSSGNQWQLIALMSRGRDGMRIECVPEDSRSDSAIYTYALMVDPKSRNDASRSIAWAATFAAVALTAATAWSRYSRETHVV